MGKKAFKKNKYNIDNISASYYSKLAYVPTELKEKNIWMAKNIFFAKRNSTLLVNPDKAKGYRKIDRGIINEQEYKKMIDPNTAIDTGGGGADFFASNFKSLPIDQNLDNIVRAKLEKIPHNINVKINDPVAKLQEQKDKEKIILQQKVRQIINYYNKELGLPELEKGIDPYKWMDAFSKGVEGDVEATKIDTIGTHLEQIRSKIQTDDQLMLYMQYIYKNGLEISFESAIKYYFIEYNKWHLRQDKFINDLKHFNVFAGQWYIDETTGRPILKYLDPSTVYTSSFTEKNGDDILYWGTEYYVNFSEFEMMLGSKLEDDQKKKILEVNNLWNSNYANSPDVINTKWGENIRSNSQVKLGYFSILTQENNTLGEYYIKDNVLCKEVQKDEQINKDGESRTFNVWYNCYYVPLPNFGAERISQEGWSWLSKYIFKVGKEIDMYRYGVDYRYAKSSLIVYRDNTRMSYTEIKERFMPNINNLWHKIQNCLVQDYNATIMAQDFIIALSNTITDANEQNKDGGQSILKQIKAMKQSGLTLAKYTDKNGQMIVDDPSRYFISFKSGHIDIAEKYIRTILVLYNQMIQSLAISQSSAGIQADPRTPAIGIEVAATATENARWYLEKPMIECVVMCSERVIQYVNSLVKEKEKYDYKDRWEEFVNIVGFANGATIEGIKDIDFENIGVTVANENTSFYNKIVLDMLLNKASSKEITSKELALVLGTENYKYRLMEMALFEDKKAEEQKKEAEVLHQRQMELQQMQLSVAAKLQEVKTSGKIAEIDALAQTEAVLQKQLNELKLQTQSLLIAQRGSQKKESALLQSELDKDKDKNKKELEEQSILPVKF